MPIYEYRCKQCGLKSTHLFRSYSDIHQPKCTHCESPSLDRLMSAFTVHTPWDSGTHIPSTDTLGDFDENDPTSTAKWVKGMRQDMGDAFGKEYNDIIEKIDSGSSITGDDNADSMEI
jgi:putative FmdB family regulatory protein